VGHAEADLVGWDDEMVERSPVAAVIVGSVNVPPHSARMVEVGKVLQKMCFLSGNRPCWRGFLRRPVG